MCLVCLWWCLVDLVCSLGFEMSVVASLAAWTSSLGKTAAHPPRKQLMKARGKWKSNSPDAVLQLEAATSLLSIDISIRLRDGRPTRATASEHNQRRNISEIQ